MLEPFFRWCESTLIGRAVADSVWAFPILKAVHLLGLCLLGGALLVRRPADARPRPHRPARVAAGAPRPPLARRERAAHGRDRRPPLPLGAIKAYYNTSFLVKMTTLPVALAFTFGVRERVARNEGLDPGPRCKVIGAVSLALWFTVAAAGRWTGFS